MTRVVLHVGANKTGSSALQAGFARYRDPLQEAGIHYPSYPGLGRAATGRFTSGNGDDIRAFLIARFRNAEFSEKAFFTTLLRRITGSPCTTVLFSNEGIHNGDPAKLRELREFLLASCDRVDVYYYVRDLLDHAWSCYTQNVKMGRETCSLRAFLATYRPSFLRNCRKFRDVFGESFNVAVYDRQREDLFGHFLEWIGCPIEGVRGIEVVNRSLSADEIPLMLAINQLRLPEDVRAKMAIRLADTERDTARGLIVDPETFSAFQARHEDGVEALNREFLAAGPIGVRSDAIRVGRVGEMRLSRQEQLLIDCMSVLAEALAGESA